MEGSGTRIAARTRRRPNGSGFYYARSGVTSTLRSRNGSRGKASADVRAMSSRGGYNGHHGIGHASGQKSHVFWCSTCRRASSATSRAIYCSNRRNSGTNGRSNKRDLNKRTTTLTASRSYSVNNVSYANRSYF